MDKLKRKPLRLPDYDYAAHGAYFITICTDQRKPLLWSDGHPHFDPQRPVGAAISRPQIHLPLSQYGRIAEQAILAIPTHYPAVTVDNYVIMPNHIHAILRITTTDGSGRMISAPTLSTVVGQMKRWVSKQAGRPIWQKSFYDHVIRNQREYLDTWAYIDGNPFQWAEDPLFCTE